MIFWYKFCNRSGATLLRTFSEEERPDEEPLKLKSQSWMLHVGGKVFVESIQVGMIPMSAPLEGGT
jgi:hypothetical protein